MPVSRTALPLPLLRRGKVRDVYEVNPRCLLLVATDRVSAFDVVMRETIPHKGAVLTQLTAWWLRRLEPLVRHHMLTADVDDIVREVPVLEPYRDSLGGRTMLCKRTDVFPVECVIRGYISGSAWKEYSTGGTLAGEPLTPGFLESQQLASPLFSPATKAETGHDENIPVSRMASIVGERATSELERLTRLVYDFGRSVAATRGIIVADTKLEFGYLPECSDDDRTPVSASSEMPATPRSVADRFDPSRVILVDEVLTPDSSRFWPEDGFEPGRPQPSFDKQPLRDYLDRERAGGRWNGESPPPALTPDVVAATSERYLDIYRRLTLAPLATGPLH